MSPAKVLSSIDKNAKKHRNLLFRCFFKPISVELERFELSSRQGINLLSTCLASLILSGGRLPDTSHLQPYSLYFALTPGPCEDYPELATPRLRNCQEKSLRSDQQPKPGLSS